ncbi:hypothetical protein DYH09_07755 [bacterium CPR1]|nr:hypothetical protein [bacterium CPR1]
MLKRLLLVILLQVAVLAQTGQPRSDRVVGYWVSSSGKEVAVAYSGQPETFLVQVYNQSGPPAEYTAHWTSDSEFYYDAKEERVLGLYRADSDSVKIFNQKRSWSAVWKRR